VGELVDREGDQEDQGGGDESRQQDIGVKAHRGSLAIGIDDL